jgi:hypothetical protein
MCSLKTKIRKRQQHLSAEQEAIIQAIRNSHRMNERRIIITDKNSKNTKIRKLRKLLNEEGEKITTLGTLGCIKIGVFFWIFFFNIVACYFLCLHQHTVCPI